MARIRTIKPDFWSSGQIMACSRETRLFFIGMWNFADDSGRMCVNEKSMRAQIFPGDLDVDSAMVRRMLVELSDNDLVRFYEVDGKEYLFITGWKHQRIDKPAPNKCPDPPLGGSTNVRRPFPPDLTLSNRIVSNLSGDADERASREGTLAHQPEIQPAAPKGTSREGKGIGPSPFLVQTMMAKGVR